MQPELLKQSAWALDKCGKPVMPAGVKCVDIVDALVYVAALPTGSETTSTGYVPITGETTFMLRAISGLPDLNKDALIQVQWPDGTFLFSQLSRLSLGCAPGSLRRTMSKEIPCPPGSQITVTLSNAGFGDPTSTQSIALTFEGVWRYLLQGTDVMPATAQQAAQSRYFQSPNGNILAPEMFLDTNFGEIPPGVTRGPYTMVSLQGQLAAPAGGIQTLKVPVSSAFDMLVRRLTFEQSFSGGATGDLLVRPRDGTGFALFTDYAPVAQIEDAPYAKEWCIKAGVNMFFDFLLRNTTGAGTLTYSVNVIGARQRRSG